VIVFKAEQRGQSSMSDRTRLREYPRDLTFYMLRADAEALRRLKEHEKLDEIHVQTAGSYSRDLGGYIAGANREKVGATLTRHLVGSTALEIAAEMEALQEAAGVGDAAVEHWVLSWREGEDPTEQFEDVVDTFIDGLGLSNCATLAVIHRDTDNVHVHIEVLKVDPATLQPVAGLSYDINRAHQMLAVLEDRYDWSREERARYAVIDGTMVQDGDRVIGRADAPSKWPDERPARRRNPAVEQPDARQEEAERKVIRTAGPILDCAKDTAELLRMLHHEGIGLRKKHRGYAFWVDGLEVKASVDRTRSRATLMKKFNDLPKVFSTQLLETATQATDPEVAAGARYTLAKQAYVETSNSAAEAFRRATGRYASAGPALRAAKASLVFPAVDAWKAGVLPPDPFEALASVYSAAVLCSRSPGEGGRQKRMDVPGTRSIQSGKWPMYYASEAFGRPPLFVDLGDRVLIVGPRDESAIRKALLLMHLRGFKDLEATGFTRAEMKAAKEYAADLGMNLSEAKRLGKFDAARDAVDAGLKRLRSAAQSMRPPTPVGTRHTAKGPSSDQTSERVGLPSISKPGPANSIKSRDDAGLSSPPARSIDGDGFDEWLRQRREREQADQKRWDSDQSSEAELIRRWQDPNVKDRERDFIAFRLQQSASCLKLIKERLPAPELDKIETAAQRHRDRLKQMGGGMDRLGR